MKLTSHKDLIVWQKAILLAKEIYILTSLFPKSEIFGIVSQMRRASVSIPSNIAEGYGRKSANEFKQFLSIAYGSALELETQVIVSKDTNLAPNNAFLSSDSLLQEVLKMLNFMTRKDSRR